MLDKQQADEADAIGAAPVNGELGVGFDARFEYRFVFLQRLGQSFLLLVVSAALFGLLGRGPFSHRTTATPDGGFSVDYEPIARYGTETQLTFHVHAPQKSSIDLSFDTKLIEPMGLQTMVPRPVVESADGAGISAQFAVRPADAEHGDMFIRVILKPDIVGQVLMRADLEGAPTLRWTQYILP